MPGLRVIATLLIAAFLSQELGWAAIAQDQAATVAKLDQSSFSIPNDIALVKENQKTDSKELIINIKDIHDNSSAQESIVALLENLIDNYQVTLVGREGPEGFIDPSILAAFPDQDILKDAGEQLMKEGRLPAG